MKVQLKVSPNAIIEAEGATQADIFEALAGLYEIFGLEKQCGLCHCDRLRPICRVVDGNKFFEFLCLQCKARFAFGQRKEPKGTLFPQRFAGKGKEKTLKPNGGWYKWEGGGNNEE